ncbi:MAG: RNA polymerase sigma factor [Limisphaerales bacterium]
MSSPQSTTDLRPQAPLPRTSATHWSWVGAAGNAASPGHETALAELGRRYWHPIFLFARRLGHSHEDASDLTQSFWASLLTRNTFSRADPHRGRFRTFLLTCFKNHLHHEHERRMAQRRGGGREMTAFDSDPREEPAVSGFSSSASPDEMFDRQWALTTLNQALEAVRLEYAVVGKAGLHDQLRAHLWDDPGETYADLAARLGMTEASVKMAVLRLRKRCRQALVEHIRQTLCDPTHVDDELQHLLGALRR